MTAAMTQAPVPTAIANGSRFVKEKSFEELNPVYDVTPYDIQEYIKHKLLENKETQLP